MDEFIKLYEPGEDSVRYVMGMGRLYANVPLLHYMQESARMVEVARVQASDHLVNFDSTSHDQNFLAGAAMAIHVNTYGSSDTLRTRVLYFNPLEDLRAAPDSAEKYDAIQSCVDVMHKWDEHGAQAAFDDQTDEFKDKLLELTIMMYNNMAHPGGSDMRFISGFMYCSQTIWSLARGAGPPA